MNGTTSDFDSIMIILKFKNDYTHPIITSDLERCLYLQNFL